MTVQQINHTTAGALAITYGSGDDAEVTLTADVTDHTITGMTDGDVLAVYYSASGSDRTIDFSTVAGLAASSTGVITVGAGETYLAVFAHQFGQLYFVPPKGDISLKTPSTPPAALTSACGRRAFPGFPTVTGTTHNVALNDLAGLNSVINIAQPGDEIVLADGVWNLEYGNGVTWSVGETQGTAENPIIWRPATQDGVTITNVDDWIVNGEHNHFWNLNIDGGTGTGSVIRFFKPHCKWLHASVDNVTTFANVFKVEDGHNLEIADIDWGVFEGIGVVMAMANGVGAAGTRAKDCHFHHWTVDNTAGTNPNSLVQTGESNLAGTPKDPATHDDYTRMLFEYNDITWHPSADGEVVSCKSSGNTMRFNIVDAQDGGGHISIRDGKDNLTYGNWGQRQSLGARMNGDGNLHCYNVTVQRQAGGTNALQWHLENTFGDVGSTNNRFERNMQVGNFTILVTTDNGQTQVADPNPTGNIIKHNWWDSPNVPSNYNLETGHTQAEVEAENTIAIDWTFDGNGNPRGPIPTSLAPLKGSAPLGHEPGTFLTVPIPFWWEGNISLGSGNQVLFPTAGDEQRSLPVAVDLAESGAVGDGTTDDGPALKAFIDRMYKAGHRVFQFSPHKQWNVLTKIEFDSLDHITFLAHGATITHDGVTGTDDNTVWKFTQTSAVNFFGGRWIGRRNVNGGTSADDGERFIVYRSGSTKLLAVDLDLRDWGGAAMSVSAENELAADPVSTDGVNGSLIIDRLRLTNSVSAVNTKGGGFSQISLSNMHAEGCVGLIKIDGEQSRGPAQTGEHNDYGQVGAVTISNIVGADMWADNVSEQALIQMEEDVHAITVNGAALRGSTDVGLVRITRGQTNKPTDTIALNGLVATGVNNADGGGNLAVVNRGGYEVAINASVFDGCDVYTATSSVRGYTVINSSVFNGGQVRTFQGDAAVNNTQFWKGAATESAPLAATDASDVIETNGCRWDSAWTQKTSGSGSHQPGPADWGNSSTTANRPTATYPGMPWFDTTLDQPIWRNTADTSWIDATGTTV